MPRISRATVDTCGGTINNSQGIGSTINSVPIAVRGDAVTPHGLPPHNAAQTTASPSTNINGIPITLQGDPATCGHLATASASSSIDPS